MLPENLAISVTDVLNYHQKREKIFVPARNYSAISLRLKTPGKYLCKNKTISFEPGSICIIPEGVAYERNNLEEDILVIHFQMLNYAMEEIQVFKVPEPEKYKNFFTKALTLKYENEVGSTYRITAVVYEILSELTRDVGFTANPNDNRIIESAEYMRQNFWNPQLSIEDLAKQTCVSSAYYRREFHRIYGTSPKEYLDTLRIQYAKSLLETNYFSQKEIAARCGFSEVGYFRSVFKRKMGKCIRDYLSDETRHEY
ncbi:MAG: helix-turn-helix transcriptional regulator [Clostridia bacterium]|nr:helix-turn-helix transcriptional regulator [Clostridia bacterium]